jgi:putative transposase
VTDIQGSAGAAEVDEEQEAGLARAALESLAAQQRLAELVSPEAVDRMLGDAEAAGMPLDGPGGLLGQLTRAVLERALGAELDDHLGYVKGDRAGNGSGNSRNGSYGKTVTTTAGPVRIDVPRDRNATFEPVIVPKGRRRTGQVDDMILSLYARGMTTRDIAAHLAEVYGAEVSPALVSRVTDVVAEEITAWQTRPLDAFYAILYIDALMVKVRDGGAVDNKAAYLVTGVDIDGFKHVLGIWLHRLVHRPARLQHHHRLTLPHQLRGVPGSGPQPSRGRPDPRPPEKLEEAGYFGVSVTRKCQTRLLVLD